MTEIVREPIEAKRVTTRLERTRRIPGALGPALQIRIQPAAESALI